MRINSIVRGVVILLCLDSLLKIKIGGLFLQAGIAASLILFLILAFAGKLKRGLSRPDAALALMFAYMLAHAATAININIYLIILMYFGIFMLLQILIQNIYRHVNWLEISSIALKTLIVTGVFQYVAINVFSHQIELRGVGSDYYFEKGTLGIRMRGFFLEPNWYGVSIFSWLFLYMSQIKKIKIPQGGLIGATLICILLSENRIIIALTPMLLAFYIIKRRGSPLVAYFPFLMVAVAGALMFLISVFFENLNDRSAMARTATAANILSLWLDVDLWRKLWGWGFSNWGYYSNLLGFSRSNFQLDQELTRRDNAEIYVFLFEMGALSFFIFLYDLFLLGKRRADAITGFYIAAVYVIGMFYPIYQFLMYVTPLMVARHEVFKISHDVRPFNKSF